MLAGCAAAGRWLQLATSPVFGRLATRHPHAPLCSPSSAASTFLATARSHHPLRMSGKMRMSNPSVRRLRFVSIAAPRAARARARAPSTRPAFLAARRRSRTPPPLPTLPLLPPRSRAQGLTSLLKDGYKHMSGACSLQRRTLRAMYPHTPSFCGRRSLRGGRSATSPPCARAPTDFSRNSCCRSG